MARHTRVEELQTHHRRMWAVNGCSLLFRQAVTSARFDSVSLTVCGSLICTKMVLVSSSNFPSLISFPPAAGSAPVVHNLCQPAQAAQPNASLAAVLAVASSQTLLPTVCVRPVMKGSGQISEGLRMGVVRFHSGQVIQILHAKQTATNEH